VGGIGHPYGRQLAGAVQPGERGGMAACLHPLAGPARDQRRRDHAALLREAAEQPMHPVAARSGFVAEAELPVPDLQPLSTSRCSASGARDLAQKTHFPPPRPDSAIATDIILLCTSNPTDVIASMWPVSYA
jgi:hypothetical protein